MKNYAAIIIMIAAIAIAACFHAQKIHKSNEELDRLGAGLQEVKNIVPTGAHISFRPINDKVEMHFWVRYVLAPRYVALADSTLDTVLTICPIQTNDSLLRAITVSKQVIWAAKDSEYHYFLTLNAHAKK